jgi:hypothetical protein
VPPPPPPARRDRRRIAVVVAAFVALFASAAVVGWALGAGDDPPAASTSAGAATSARAAAPTADARDEGAAGPSSEAAATTEPAATTESAATDPPPATTATEAPASTAPEQTATQPAGEDGAERPDAAPGLVALGGSSCDVDVPRGWEVVALDQDRDGVYTHNQARSPDGAAEVVCDVDVVAIGAEQIARRVHAHSGQFAGYREGSFGPEQVAGRDAWAWRFSAVTDGQRVNVTDVFFPGGVALLVRVRADREGDYRALLDRVLQSYRGSRNDG